MTTTQSLLNRQATIIAQLNGTITNQREVSKRSNVPCTGHASHVLDVVEAYLEAYRLTGSDLSTMPLATLLSETMVEMVAWLLDLDYYKSFDLTEFRMDELCDVVERANSIANMVGEEDYGDDMFDRFNAFQVQAEELEDEF